MESGGNMPHYYSAAFKSRERGHDSIPMRSTRSSQFSDTQACRDSGPQREQTTASKRFSELGKYRAVCFI